MIDAHSWIYPKVNIAISEDCLEVLGQLILHIHLLVHVIEKITTFRQTSLISQDME